MSSIEKMKQDLITEIDKRLEDGIIEKSNADLLKKLICNAESEDEAISIAALGTTYKRTGFHFDKRLEKTEDTIRYFKKNEELSFVTNNDGITHKLIIGDNYPALLNLLIQHRNKIDTIYIDPPYGKDSMGEFANTNYDNAITRDNLLSMLYPRLTIARQLLSENGVIFCSIDDKNQAYVKGLFDEIFGEANSVGEYVWHKKLTGGYDNKNINIQHEYILVYARNYSTDLLNDEIPTASKYTLEDEDGRKYKWDSLWNVGGLTYSASLDYPIKAPDGTEIWPIGERGVAFWLWSKEKVAQERDKLNFKKNKDGQWRVYKKVYASDTIVSGSMLDASVVKGNTNASAEIKQIFGTKIFDYAKPTELIRYLIDRGSRENSIVLDFFAGSGTTGQAVLELNKQGGNRRFILITNNEQSPATPNGIAHDVTTKRLKRVMDGKCYDGTNGFKWLDKNQPLGDNLDVYDIATISPYDEKPFEVIDETLYGKEKLDVNEKVKWVCENFEHTQKILV